jgi:hypothetical protein
VKPDLFLIPIIGALALAYGILVNVFNQRATRWGKRFQRFAAWYWPESEELVTPIFVRLTGIYTGLFGIVFLIAGVTALFQT